MIKNGKVEIGKTPSAVSGKTATRLVDGEPVRRHEQTNDPGLKKLASLIQVDMK